MRASFAILAAALVGCAVQPTEDIESAVNAACCGANCCLIDGMCRTVGETNPENECEICMRGGGGSANSWTAVPDCTPADAGAPMDAAPEGDAGDDDAGPVPMMDSGPMDDAGGGDDAGGDTDAGSSADAGGGTDAGGGADAGDGGGGGGGCSVASGSQNVWLLAIGIVALVWRRRRLS